jgi:hypothetical protein
VFLAKNSLYDAKMLRAIDQKIETEQDFAIIDVENSINIIATDNMASKRLIAENVRHFILVGCEKDMIEIRNYLDETDKAENIWNETNGYASTQNFLSNLYASAMLKFIMGSEDYIKKLSNNEKFHFLSNVPALLSVLDMENKPRIGRASGGIVCDLDKHYKNLHDGKVI